MVRFGTTVTVRDTIAMQMKDSDDRRSLMLYGKTLTEEIELDWKDGGKASFFRKNDDVDIAKDLKLMFDDIDHLWKTMRSWFRGKLVEIDDSTSESPIEEVQGNMKFDGNDASELLTQEVQANTKSDGNVASELPTQEANSSTSAGTTLPPQWYAPLHQIPKPWARPKTNEAV